MNILKKIHTRPALKRIKAKRAKLAAQMKKLGRQYKTTFKSEARKLRKKG